MFRKHNAFVSKAKISACMYFLVVKYKPRNDCDILSSVKDLFYNYYSHSTVKFYPAVYAVYKKLYQWDDLGRINISSLLFDPYSPFHAVISSDNGQLF
jgi:hypothetical protein